MTVFRGCCVRCCQVGGSAGLRQFAFICGFLTTPPFHGSPSDQIRISRAAVSHLRRPNLAFFARDIISGSVTHCCQSRFVFSFPFFLSLFSFFFFFFLDDKGTDNWTRDLQPERSTRTLEFFFFLISFNVYRPTRDRSMTNISLPSLFPRFVTIVSNLFIHREENL